MKSILLSILSFMMSVSLFSQTKNDSIEQIAMQYMEAYGNWDFDKMETFYVEDVKFEDPTANEAFRQAFVFEGKENVYTLFNGVFKGKFKNNKLPYVDFIVGKKFVSGSFVVINSTFECILPASWFQKDSKETVLISIPFVTILKIKNGLIKQHIDYGDYSKYKTQIKALNRKENLI